MAHFANIDVDGFVMDVVVVANECVENLGFPDSEPVGVNFCQLLYGGASVWKQTSYNASFRKNYAGKGYRYDEGLDAFIPPRPYPSWVLNMETCQWASPIDMPKASPGPGQAYKWDENIENWVIVETNR